MRLDTILHIASSWVHIHPDVILSNNQKMSVFTNKMLNRAFGDFVCVIVTKQEAGRLTIIDHCLTLLPVVVSHNQCSVI